MNKLSAFVFTLVLASTGVILNTPGYAGEIEMNDEQNAKVARFKARARVANNKKITNYFPETEDESELAGGIQDKACGTVDIGNVTENSPFGKPPSQVDVIITGDVINTSNECR